MMDVQRELKNDLTSVKGAIETQEGIYIPLKEVERMLLNRIEQVKNNDLLHSVSERVFCFLYSDGDEIHSKSAIAETRTEARKIIEDKYPKLFLLRNDSSYENVR